MVDGVLNRRFSIACALLLASLAAGCTHTHVSPWQRTKLAHPTMTLEPAGAAQEHVYSVHEGAVGGSGSVESGCGCN
jgi:hypothetical protein